MGELYRPHYHFTPPANWMNDPNGLVYLMGEYHLFYQYHPASTVWGPTHWGHAVSRDLVHWQYLPIALYPDEQGMIFSGSAVVDWEDTAGFGRDALVAVFTYHKDHVETQNLAYSTDLGRTWTKYAGNPVIPNPGLPDFRDPKVFWHEDHWVMALAAGNVILFYTSSDLKKWEQSGSFGDGYGCTDGVWETPDLFRLNIDGSDETYWVLTVGVGNGAPAGGSGTQYFIGDFDGKRFISENPKELSLWADHGADYYAAQSWSDEPNHRRLMLGWMNNWQYALHVPTASWRGSFSLVRELALTRTEQGVRLLLRPVPEMQALRREQLCWHREVIQPGTNLLSNVQGNVLEIIAEFEIDEDSDRFGFRIRVGENEHTTICYAVKEKRLSVDRTHSGQVDFKDGFAGVHSADLSPMNNVLRLHIFVDSASVEVFADDGLVTFSECIFPSEGSDRLELFAEGGTVLLTSLTLFHLNPATFQTIEN
ncbi:MAG TPA: glycoside hydrolase family 32 protein [Anaerolineales bacterium]|nr:glycoside hydrolase family 32 protein [Anaerolineales bacterium]